MAASDERELQIFVVSDGTGETAEAAARAAMTQFASSYRTRSFGEIRDEAQLERVLAEASERRAVVVFTIVRESLAKLVVARCAALQLRCVDLLGPVLSALEAELGLEPEHRPGLAHGVTEDYFRRVEAVEFAVGHDDGAGLAALRQADLVLVGVSRSSKTPLSMYLAHRGYKAGNVPLVAGIAPPEALLELTPSKVFGLVVNPGTLTEVRRARVRALGSSPWSSYADAEAIREELLAARRLFREHGWRSIDITARAVEENAARLIEMLQSGDL
jgi:regulator of PEP synthase PpsR (kinase-PPPase family)